MGLAEADLEAVLACGEDVSAIIAKLDSARPAALARRRSAPSAGPRSNRNSTLQMPMADGALRRLVWLRAVLHDPTAKPATVRELRLNTVPATQAATRLDERLGRSNGRPGQSFHAAKDPGADRSADRRARPRARAHRRAGHDASGRASTASSRKARRARSTCSIRPPAPSPSATAAPDRSRSPTRRSSRAATAMAAARSAMSRRTRSPRSRARSPASSPSPTSRTAADGSDAETLEDAKLRAPHDLRTRDRAVTAEDFAYLAGQTPTVAVHKAYALARRVPDERRLGLRREGRRRHRWCSCRPTTRRRRSRARRSCARCANGWSRAASSPPNCTSPVRATPRSARSPPVSPSSPAHDLRTVAEAATAALTGFLHPLTGGDRRHRLAVRRGHLSRRSLRPPARGDRRAPRQRTDAEPQGRDGDTDPLADVTALPEGHLPYLPRSAIALDVRYD